MRYGKLHALQAESEGMASDVLSPVAIPHSDQS